MQCQPGSQIITVSIFTRASGGGSTAAAKVAAGVTDRSTAAVRSTVLVRSVAVRSTAAVGCKKNAVVRSTAAFGAAPGVVVVVRAAVGRAASRVKLGAVAVDAWSRMRRRTDVEAAASRAARAKVARRSPAASIAAVRAGDSVVGVTHSAGSLTMAAPCVVKSGTTTVGASAVAAAGATRGVPAAAVARARSAAAAAVFARIRR